MGRWRYVGPGPQDDPEGGIVRPGDIREFDAVPDWGPWEGELPDEDTAVQEAPEATETPAAPPPAPASPGPAAASPVPPKPFGTETAPEGG